MRLVRVRTMSLRVGILTAVRAIQLAAASGCVTESSRTLTPATVASSQRPYSGPTFTLVVGKFQNRSTYMRGIFSEGQDQLGNQAKTILKTHLQQTGRFAVVDRENLSEIAQEASIRGEQQQLKGAQVAITGDVTEFGRRETGDVQLFGIPGPRRISPGEPYDGVRSAERVPDRPLPPELRGGQPRPLKDARSPLA